MNPDLLILRLSNCRVFADLSPAELRMLADFGAVRPMAKGDPVEAGRGELLAVLIGKVVVNRARTAEGAPRTRKVGAGAVLNELAFLGGEELVDGARCSTKGWLFALGRETFDKLVELGNTSAAKIGVALARSVATRLRERNAALLALMEQHEAVLDSMDRLLTDPEVQAELFGKGSTGQREFATFRDTLLANWDY